MEGPTYGLDAIAWPVPVCTNRRLHQSIFVNLGEAIADEIEPWQLRYRSDIRACGPIEGVKHHFALRHVSVKEHQFDIQGVRLAQYPDVLTSVDVPLDSIAVERDQLRIFASRMAYSFEQSSRKDILKPVIIEATEIGFVVCGGGEAVVSFVVQNIRYKNRVQWSLGH